MFKEKNLFRNLGKIARCLGKRFTQLETKDGISCELRRLPSKEVKFHLNKTPPFTCIVLNIYQVEYPYWQSLSCDQPVTKNIVCENFVSSWQNTMLEVYNLSLQHNCNAHEAIHNKLCFSLHSVNQSLANKMGLFVLSENTNLGPGHNKGLFTQNLKLYIANQFHRSYFKYSFFAHKH